MNATAHLRFLDWSEGPLLPRAAEMLIASAREDSAGLDLSTRLVVVAGRRAGRLLTGFLVDLAEERGVGLAPPEIITPRDLPERLESGRERERGSATARRLAWVDVLRTARAEVLAGLWPGRIETASEARRLAQTLERWSDDLASAGLRFASAAERLGDRAPEEEIERLRALAGLQSRYEARLAERGLVDPALAAADRWFASDATGSGAAVTLVGVAELRPVEHRALERGAGEVDSVVFAPETERERFDDLGCVRAAAWEEAPIDLPEDRVIFADDARDQAERALARIGEIGGASGVEASAVAVGYTSGEEIEALRRRAADAGVRLRVAPGRAGTHTSAGRLIARLAAHAKDPTLSTFIELLRHPDVERAATADAGTEAEVWIERLDAAQREYVLSDWRSPPRGIKRRLYEAITASAAQLRELLGSLLEEPSRERSAQEWARAIADALARVLGDEAEQGDVEVGAVRAISGALEELAVESDHIDAEAALALVLERLEATSLAEAPARDAIETIGWLELLADPSPQAVVIGMSDDRVPGPRAVDGVLVESARAPLGLPDASSRVARDAYLLSAIAASRDATFLCPRRDLSGDPVRPSRLLLRCSGERLARRVRRFVGDDRDPAPRVRVATAPGERDRFHGPIVVAAGYEPPESVRVTDFAVYLRSPAQWYLERVLRYEDLGEAPRELTPAAYGSLAHAALELYGRDPECVDLTDPERAARALSAKLDEALRASYAPQPPAPMSLQREMMRQRLGFLAAELARRRNQGWRIAHVEWSPEPGSAALEVDGAAVGLRGKIDRIDVRDAEWAVVDYKTGRAPSGKIESTHFQERKKRWINLQLPLYRLLIAGLEPPERVHLGLCYLPRKAGEDALRFCSWDQEHLAGAEEAARDVVRQMRSLRAGDAIELGDTPPSEGALGWMTGERFVRGVDDDEEDDGEDAA